MTHPRQSPQALPGTPQPLSWQELPRDKWPSWSGVTTAAASKEVGILGNRSILVQYHGKSWALYYDGNLYVGSWEPEELNCNNLQSAFVWANGQIAQLIARFGRPSGSVLWHLNRAKKPAQADSPGKPAATPGQTESTVRTPGGTNYVMLKPTKPRKKEFFPTRRKRNVLEED